MERRRDALVSRLPLLTGIVAAGLGAQAAGLDTENVAIAFAVMAVGVFLGVGLRKAALRR